MQDDMFSPESVDVAIWTLERWSQWKTPCCRKWALNKAFQQQLQYQQGQPWPLILCNSADKVDVLRGVNVGSVISRSGHDYVWLSAVLGLVSPPKYTPLTVVCFVMISSVVFVWPYNWQLVWQFILELIAFLCWMKLWVCVHLINLHCKNLAPDFLSLQISITVIQKVGNTT